MEMRTPGHRFTAYFDELELRSEYLPDTFNYSRFTHNRIKL